MLINGDCLEELKKLPDKSIDFFYADLPYGETACKWDTCIDLTELWKQYKRLAKHDRVAYVFSCSSMRWSIFSIKKHQNTIETNTIKELKDNKIVIKRV